MPHDTIFFGPVFVSIWMTLNMLASCMRGPPCLIYTLDAFTHQRRVFRTSSFRLLEEKEFQRKQHWAKVEPRAPVKQRQETYGDANRPP